MPELVVSSQSSIFRDPSCVGKPRLRLPTENPKYPETKHTRKKVLHNVTTQPVTDKAGAESYDPVLGGGKSVVDHYPYCAISAKEVLIQPR